MTPVRQGPDAILQAERPKRKKKKKDSASQTQIEASPTLLRWVTELDFGQLWFLTTAVALVALIGLCAIGVL